jgi:threonyl-tRNA synthetase
MCLRTRFFKIKIMEVVMIKVTFPDKSVRDYEKGIKASEVAKSISEGFARNLVGAVYNGKTIGLQNTLNEDGTIKFLKFEDKEGKDVFWHTSSHIMAHAIKRLWPEAKLAIGPAIENGFYYDIDLEHRLTQEDLEKIEAEMKNIVKAGYELERFELPREEAVRFMEEAKEDYKVELINDLPEDAVISFYKHGDFVDLCAGPHLESTKKPKAFKLLSVAGAYWRGNEKNKMLQRVYGISFEKAKDLEAYLKMLEEAKKRDHRKLGKELELFMMSEEGPGFPFFLPKGVTVKNELMKYWREVHKKAGYVEIETPLILNQHLWEVSGHWYNYRENMYLTSIDDQDYAIKPMNCPGGILVYKNSLHSYKDFPMRVAEGHISHILSARLSSRPMGWSIIGADEMARMRAYKANGGSIKEYYRKVRAERKKEERILELDKKVVKDIKRTYNNVDPDMMIDMSFTYRTEGRWLKNMINCSGF